MRSVILKLKRVVPVGTPPRSNDGEIDEQAGMPNHENRKDRDGPSSDVEREKLK